MLFNCQARLLPVFNMFMISSRTTSSFVALLSGPLVGTTEYVSYVILCCIYVAGLLEAGCFCYLREYGTVQGLLIHESAMF